MRAKLYRLVLKERSHALEIALHCIEVDKQSWSIDLVYCHALAPLLGQYFLVQLDFETFHQLGPDVIEIVLNVRHGTMLIEYFLVRPFLDKADPARVINALIQLVSNTAGFFMSGLHQTMKGRHELVGFVLLRPELCNANNSYCVFFWHDHLATETPLNVR